LAASGVAGPRWTFEGFLPRSGRERRERLARIAADERGAVIYEAPNRAASTLADLATACGPERPAAICRELTKLHESIVRGSLGDLAAAAAAGARGEPDGIPARGEFAIVIGFVSAVATANGPDGDAADLASARAEVERLVAAGVARGEAARRVAAATGLARRRLYGAEPGR
jgi:16S rRNA (cytidine1402-2'-O)-methyltransferase